MVPFKRGMVAAQVYLNGSFMAFPKRITLELTNHCNLRCVFCPRRFMEKETGFMDVGLGRELLAEMENGGREYGKVTVVPFFRGESLTHPQWDVFLEGLHRHGLGPIQMATNASLLTEEKARRILELGIDTLSFSMDTLDPDLYRELRGSDYARSLGNVLRFLELRAGGGGKGCGTVQVSAVETDKNREGINAFIDFWRGKVDRVRIYPEHSADGNPGSLPGAKPVGERKPCHKVSEDMVIYWNGEAALCNHDWTRLVTGQNIGNVGQDGIKRVWESEPYERIRAAHKSGNLKGVAPCENCGHWGNEPVGRVVENGACNNADLHNRSVA